MVVKRGKMRKYLSLILVLMACVSCQSAKKDDNQINSQNINYREHIIVKGGDENHVIYEYSDVRIDEVASLAIAYCQNINPEHIAKLRDIYMYKNHKRRATFDCACVAER